MGLAALATANLSAAAREHRLARVASDVVVAEVVVTVDAANTRPGSVALTISISNTGPALTIQSPRVETAGYRVEPVGPLPAGAAPGQTVLLSVRLRAACRAEADVPPRLVVRVTPPSGRVHEVTAAVSPDLSELACGRRTPSEAAGPSVVSVRSEPAAVTFVLRLSNRSRDVLLLDGLAAEGLRLQMSTPPPVAVPAGATAQIPVRLAVASCAHLPTPLDAQRIDTLPFAAFELSLSSGGGTRDTLPYLTDGSSPLYSAVRALAHRSCPSFSATPVIHGHLSALSSHLAAEFRPLITGDGGGG